MACVDVNYKIIGLNVSIHRHQRCWTQEQLAELAGLSKQFICNIECGRTIPSLKTVLSLCAALDVEPNDLLRHTFTRNPDSPCTLRDDHSVFAETITDMLFPEGSSEVCIDAQDLPLFDIDLTEPDDDA